MKLSIIIINYKSKEFLKTCLESVFTQKTQHDFEVIVIDNASEDLADIKRIFPNIILFTNTVNVGFAAGMNQGICMSEAEYIMTLNPDVILENDYIEKCIQILDTNKSVASVTGKLLYYDFSKNKKTNIIDSTGLIMKKTRHAYDRGQGEKDDGTYDNKKSIWGVSAAAAVYRREPLVAVKDEYGFFDSRFFMYKEDVDLSWRLHNQGFKSAFIFDAIAYHRRGTGITDPSLSLLKKIRLRKTAKTKEVRRRSFQNQVRMQKKNDHFLSKLRDFYIYYPYKLTTLLYYFFFDPGVFKKINK